MGDRGGIEEVRIERVGEREGRREWGIERGLVR